MKDGTTRQKKKILTVKLQNGEELPLGFQHVARETGETISSTVRKKLLELDSTEQTFSADKREPAEDEVNQEDSFLATMLKKLAYFMGDRAANEGKADELLNRWRLELLQQAAGETENGNISAVHSLHCMAHALLGFVHHGNAQFQQLQTELNQQDIKLGRDQLSFFSKFLSTLKFITLVRTTSEPFGKSSVAKNRLCFTM